MALTERQGGSDVQANTRVPSRWARAAREKSTNSMDKVVLLAPMCDAFLTLAQSDKGLSVSCCRAYCRTASANGFHLQRLKEKLGIVLTLRRGRVSWCAARMIGKKGAACRRSLRCAAHTSRLCLRLGGDDAPRAGRALHQAAFRHAFGKRLLDQPLMRNVLADLCLETEGATALALRLARASTNHRKTRGSAGSHGSPPRSANTGSQNARSRL